MNEPDTASILVRLGTRRLGAWAGIAGPVIFATVYAIEGWLRPGYDSRTMYLSELSLGPRGFVGILNLIIYGTALLVFARGMAAEFRHGTASRAGPMALRLSGISLLGAGVFVMDSPSTPPSQLSWHGWLHGLGGLCTYTFPLACLVYQKRFGKERPWQVLAPWSLAVGVVIAVLGLGFKLLIYWYWLVLGTLRVPWGGLAQRTFFGLWVVWQLAVALRLYERSRGSMTVECPHRLEAWSQLIDAPNEVLPNLKEVRCSFCQKTGHEVAKLIAGPPVPPLQRMFGPMYGSRRCSFEKPNQPFQATAKSRPRLNGIALGVVSGYATKSSLDRPPNPRT